MTISYRLIRRAQVELMLGISRSTIYVRLDPKSKQYDPDFPKPIQLCPSSTSVAWVENECQEYIALRIAESRKVGVDESRKALIASKRQ